MNKKLTILVIIFAVFSFTTIYFDSDKNLFLLDFFSLKEKELSNMNRKTIDDLGMKGVFQSFKNYSHHLINPKYLSKDYSNLKMYEIKNCLKFGSYGKDFINQDYELKGVKYRVYQTQNYFCFYIERDNRKVLKKYFKLPKKERYKLIKELVKEYTKFNEIVRVKIVVNKMSNDFIFPTINIFTNYLVFSGHKGLGLLGNSSTPIFIYDWFKNYILSESLFKMEYFSKLPHEKFKDRKKRGNFLYIFSSLKWNILEKSLKSDEDKEWYRGKKRDLDKLIIKVYIDNFDKYEELWNSNPEKYKKSKEDFYNDSRKFKIEEKTIKLIKTLIK